MYAPLYSHVHYVQCSFMSTPDKLTNKYYLGPAPLDDMARWEPLIFLSFRFIAWFAYQNMLKIELNSWCRQIATAFGPCGNNRDYLFLLEKAMHDIGKFLLCSTVYTVHLKGFRFALVLIVLSLFSNNPLSKICGIGKPLSLSSLRLCITVLPGVQDCDYGSCCCPAVLKISFLVLIKKCRIDIWKSSW